MSLDVSPAGELWRKTLSQIPSRFGRLVYLSSLRDPITGEYHHHGFAQRFSPREADRTLARSHADTLEDWLCFSLEQQKEDLEQYLFDLPSNRSAVLANWKRMPPFQNMLASSTREAQRQLFLSDLDMILSLLESV